MQSNYVKIAVVAIVSSVATLAGYKMLGFDEKPVILNESNGTVAGLNRLVEFNGSPDAPGSFTYAAEISTPSVVHIKATAVRQVRRQRVPSIFEDFFGGEDFFGPSIPQSQQQQSSGSGVIISSDGYIATNNHVVEGADELEVVTSDNKSYVAKVIGTDPSTDIAVIKVEQSGLAAMTFGNSDNARVGEWVLAVGNPFSLESTVTAGIISAIGRDISILKNKFNQDSQRLGRAASEVPIESFIQTDAAVNPGNSGGALVNLRGELIGINTAIASPNGAYAGYAFAVPSSIVKKVTTDIIKYGNVQRGYLGLVPVELNSKNAKELDLKISNGIYADEVPEDGGAYAAGLRKGDVVLEVDGITVTSEPRFRELIGRKRPGEKVQVLVDRSGKKKTYEVTLRNREGGEGIVKKTPSKTAFAKLGVELENLSAKTKASIGIRNGVRVKGLNGDGDIARYTDIREGFIITRVGDVRIDSEEDFVAAIDAAKNAKEEGILICGIYEGYTRNYCFGLALN